MLQNKMINKCNTYKDSGIEWIGKIPQDWSVTKIGQIYNERNEKVSDKEYSALSVTKNGIVPQLETAAKTDNGDNRKLVKINETSKGIISISVPLYGISTLINIFTIFTGGEKIV